MRIFLVSFFSVFFFSSCAPSSLIVTSDESLALHQNNTAIRLARGVEEVKHDRYNNLNIIQYKIKGANNVLLYEHVEADINWEFIHGPISTLKYIFDGTKAEILYQDSNINLLQLKISKSKYINILAESSSFNTLSYVYGFSNSEFLELVKIFNKESSLKYKGTVFSYLDEVVSKWSVRMLLLNPLLKPDARRGSDF